MVMKEAYGVCHDDDCLNKIDSDKSKRKVVAKLSYSFLFLLVPFVVDDRYDIPPYENTNAADNTQRSRSYYEHPLRIGVLGRVWQHCCYASHVFKC